jgi:gluconolactonase
MGNEAIRPEFLRLIDEHAPLRQVGSGFTFTEGPIWHPREHYLLFSDMPGDVRRRYDRNGLREVMRPSNKANGLTYDRDLNLIACEHATSSLVRFRPDGTRQVLVSHFEGKELNSPNDVCVRSDGSIYFSDPWYGRMPVYGVERPRQLGWQGVFRVRPGQVGGEPQLLVDRYTFTMPNGLCFSPDEQRLYINDTEQANIRVFDVKADGSLGNGRVFASGIKDALKPGVPDGMKCDAEGNVWVTAPGGLWVYSPDGRLIGKIGVPELPANLHWGGPDWRTLFITATTSLYAIETKVGPRNEPFMRADAGLAPAATASAGGRADTSLKTTPDLKLDPTRCALIIQDMQNDVVMEGGAFAASGSPIHCREQNAIANARRLAERCRQLGIPVIHVWFQRRPDGRDMTLNAPLFEGAADAKAMIEGTWGAEPVPGLEAQAGDLVVKKQRMSAWEGTNLETLLKAEGRDIIIETGAWTNMSIEHTARTGADKGYVMVIPEDACSTMNADWHRVSINYAMQNVAAVSTTDVVLQALDSGAAAASGTVPPAVAVRRGLPVSAAERDRSFLFLVASGRSGGNAEMLARRAASALPSACRQVWLSLGAMQLPAFQDHRHGTERFEPPQGDLKTLMEATLAATDLVFVTPAYWYSAPAAAKLYLDHWTGWMNLEGVNFKGTMAAKTFWMVGMISEGDIRRAAPLLGMLRMTANYFSAGWGGSVLGLGRRPGEVMKDEPGLRDADRLFATGGDFTGSIPPG